MGLRKLQMLTKNSADKEGESQTPETTEAAEEQKTAPAAAFAAGSAKREASSSAAEAAPAGDPAPAVSESESVAEATDEAVDEAVVPEIGATPVAEDAPDDELAEKRRILEELEAAKSDDGEEHTPYYDIAQEAAESGEAPAEEGAGVSTERLDERIAQFHFEQGKKHLEKGVESIWLAGCELLDDGRYEELREFVDKRTHSLRREAHRLEVTRYSLDELQNNIIESKEGLRTGYPGLDKFVRIPQEALTLLAGLPSHGKTTLQLNLLVSLMEEYPEKAFFFFSYEETRKHLAMKILAMLSGYVFDESRNFSMYEEYVKEGRTDVPELEEGKRKLAHLMETGRLWLVDESMYVDELRDQLAALKEQHDIGAVFIDYLQKVRIRGEFPDRYAELQRISGDFLEMAKDLELAIVLGAQLETRIEIEDCVKLDQLREAGDIEQDANLIMAIYNRAMAKARTGRKIHDRTIDVTLSILKNRNGAVNHDVRLRFDRPILQMLDVSEKEWNMANHPGQIRRV